MTNILYTRSATSTGDGRNGHARSTDGQLETDDGAMRKTVQDRLAGRFGNLDAELAGKRFPTGGTFTVAEACGFAIVSWTPPLPNIGAWPGRVAARPAVAETLGAETA